MNRYSTKSFTALDPRHQRMEDPEIPMTHAQYEKLLQGLKACEVNYKSQMQRLGATTSGELRLWAKNLRQLAPWQIEDGFQIHVRNSQWYPTAADIINASVNYPQPKASERPSDALALPEPERKTVPMPPEFRSKLKALFQTT